MSIDKPMGLFCQWPEKVEDGYRIDVPVSLVVPVMKFCQYSFAVWGRRLRVYDQLKVMPVRVLTVVAITKELFLPGHQFAKSQSDRKRIGIDEHSRAHSVLGYRPGKRNHDVTFQKELSFLWI